MLTLSMLQYNNTLYNTSILSLATSHCHLSEVLQDQDIILTAKVPQIQDINGERAQTWVSVEKANLHTKGQ